MNVHYNSQERGDIKCSYKFYILVTTKETGLNDASLLEKGGNTKSNKNSICVSIPQENSILLKQI